MMRNMLCAAALAAVLLPGLAAAHAPVEIVANPIQPRAQIARTTASGAFSVVVAPNLVEYARAGAAALAESARYCQSIGKTAPAEFGRVRRYSDLVLEGWEFRGRCR